MNNPIIEVTIYEEHGYSFSMMGLASNRDKNPESMGQVAGRLAGKGHGHDKFMRVIIMNVIIRAPRYFWQEWDAYKAPNDGCDGPMPTGIVAQSQSTMNTIMKRLLTLADFVSGTTQAAVDLVNSFIPSKDKRLIKIHLPEGFMQTRYITINYAALREIVEQRRTHGLPEWRYFCDYILEHAEHKELLCAC